MDRAGGYDQYGFVAEFYDFIEPYRQRPDVDFYIELAQQSGGPVLEVGCGTGRILLPVARSGVTITGLDLSTGMLEICRRKLAQEPAEVQSARHVAPGRHAGFRPGADFRPGDDAFPRLSTSGNRRRAAFLPGGDSPASCNPAARWCSICSTPACPS